MCPCEDRWGTVKSITKLVMNRLMTNNCMAQYNLTGKGNNVKLEGINVHKLICESVQGASDKQNLTCTLDQINKHIREHLKCANLRLGGKRNADQNDE